MSTLTRTSLSTTTAGSFRTTGSRPSGSMGGSSTPGAGGADRDRKSTRLNSSHSQISYAVFCLKKKIESSLTLTGEDNQRTAMAKTVGLPLGIASQLILNGKIQLEGLHIHV